MELVEIKDGKVCLNFHPGQKKAWDSQKRFVFVLGGTQSGKTSWGPWWLYREIKRSQGGDHLAVTSTFDLFRMKMLPALRYVFEQVLGIGRFFASERVMEIRNPITGKFEAELANDPMWGRIILRSAVAGTKRESVGAGGLESATVRSAWLDEIGLDSFSLEAWLAVLRRLSLSEGRILATTTLYNISWLKREIYDRWEKGDETIDVIQFPSIANPAFPRREYNRAKKTLPPWKFSMLYDAQYSHPTGQIYHDFDESTHIVKPFDIPAEWPRFVGIDPGAIHTATLYLAEDISKKAFYAYRVIVEGNLTSSQHATRALQRTAKERVVKWCGGAASEKQFRLDWQEAGVAVTPPPISDVESGIDRVIELLKEKRLFFFDNCEVHSPSGSLSDFPDIFSEFSQYSRKIDKNGELTEEIKDKDKYHRLDALRYAVLAALHTPLHKPKVPIPRAR